MTDSLVYKDFTLKEAMQHLQSVKQLSVVRSFEELGNHVLPEIVRELGSNSAFLYITDSRLTEPVSLLYGYRPDLFEPVESLWTDHQNQMLKAAGLQPIAVLPAGCHCAGYALELYSLAQGEICLGMLGLVREAGVASKMSTWLGEFLSLVASTADRIAEMGKQQRQIAHLNTYITVSSMLAQSIGLRELIQSALYCCKEIAGGEEASILLLDDEKKNLFFYELEGSSKELLVGSSFPADKRNRRIGYPIPPIRNRQRCATRSEILWENRC